MPSLQRISPQAFPERGLPALDLNLCPSTLGTPKPAYDGTIVKFGTVPGTTCLSTCARSPAAQPTPATNRPP